MTRFTFVLLVLFFVLGTLLLAMGSGRREPGEIVIWTQQLPAERTVLDTLLARFMRMNPGTRVSQIYYENEELRSNFIIAALGGSGPELVSGPSDNVGPFEVMGIIRPLEELFQPEWLDQFVPEALVWRNRHLYQLADQIGNHLALVYNKELIAKPPETMNELIEVGQKLTQDVDGDGLMDQYALAWNFIEPFFFVPFLGGYGGWVMDDQGRPTLNTEATVKACQLIVDLRNKYKIVPRECDLDITNTLFKQRKAAMVINGPWSWGSYKEAGIDVGLARIPKINETGLWPTPMVSPRGYSINVNVKGAHLDLTVKLLKHLLSPESQLEFSKAVFTIPSHREARANPIVMNNELLRQSQYQLEVGKPMPIDPAMRAIWDAMRPAYQSVINGTMTPKQAAEAMQREAEKKIAEMFE